MSTIYGIDLGTSNCLVAELVGSGEGTDIFCLPIEENTNDDSFKSIVHFKDMDTTLIGKEAEQMLVDAPDQTIELLKTRIGKDSTVEISFPSQSVSEKYSPQEISAIMLNHIHRRHPNKVKKAVLTVPADFDQNKKGITKQIGELSGIEIVELIEEPSAALMYYLYNQFKSTPAAFEVYRKSPKNYLVFDFGGGTLDLSFINVAFDEEGNIRPKVLEKGGDMALGGNNIDLKLCKYFLNMINETFPEDAFLEEVIEEFEYYEENLRYRSSSSLESKKFLSLLKYRVEQIKIALSDCQEEEEVDLESPFIEYEEEYFISREDFENEILDEHFRRPIIEAIEDIVSQINKNGHGEIDQILLVGGSSKIPYFKSMLEEKFVEARGKFISFEEYDTAIAKGAAILGAINQGIEVAPFALNRCFNTIGHDIILSHHNTQHTMIQRGTEFPFKTAVKEKIPIKHSLKTHIPFEIMENYGNELRTIKKVEFYHPFFYTNETVTISLDIDNHGLLSFNVIHDSTNEDVEFETEKVFLLSTSEMEQAREKVKQIQ